MWPYEINNDARTQTHAHQRNKRWVFPRERSADSAAEGRENVKRKRFEHVRRRQRSSRTSTLSLSLCPRFNTWASVISWSMLEFHKRLFSYVQFTVGIDRSLVHLLSFVNENFNCYRVITFVFFVCNFGNWQLSEIFLDRNGLQSVSSTR